jgi:putative glutamine amidotransferase
MPLPDPDRASPDATRASPRLARIAIAPRRFAGDPHAAGAWRARQLFFERTLLERVAAAAALPIGLHLPSADEGAALAEHYAALCDGLLLQGGTDIGPVHSQAETNGRPDAERDAFELALIAAFERRDKAILGICRGMQLINVAAGGTLRAIDADALARHSDPARYAGHAHAVELAGGGYLARLYNSVAGEVSSAHRQTIATLGAGLVAEARDAAGGTIEALRSTQGRYVVGVQWHPEFDGAAAGRLDGSRLIDDFVAHARDAGRDSNRRTEADTSCSIMQAL